MELDDFERNDIVSLQTKELLAEKDARIAELAESLKHEREQIAKLTQALASIASMPGTTRHRFPFRRLNPNNLYEGWVINLMSNVTWPGVLGAMTAAYAAVTHLDWSVPDKALAHPMIFNAVIYWGMNILTWWGGKTKYRKEWGKHIT